MLVFEIAPRNERDCVMMYPEFEEYLEYLKERVGFSISSLNFYQRVLYDFRGYLIDSSESLLCCAEVSIETANSYIQGFVEQGFSEYTTKKKRAALKGLLAFLGIEWAFDDINEEVGKACVEHEDVVSEEDFEKIIQVCRNGVNRKKERIRDVAILEIVRSTGISVLDIVSLNLESIKVDGEKVCIHCSNQSTIRDTSKLLSDSASEALFEYVAKYRNDFLLPGQSETALFVGIGHERVDRNGVRGIIRKRLQQAGFEGVNIRLL